MSLRIEVNNIAIAGGAGYTATPIKPMNPYEAWVRVHEYQVGTGFTYNWLLTLYTAEPLLPIQGTASLGWLRLSALTSTLTNIYNPILECNYQSAALTNKVHTPRLVIIPCGDGIRLTAGQGIRAECMRSTVTTVYRYWVNFWGNAERTT